MLECSGACQHHSNLRPQILKMPPPQPQQTHPNQPYYPPPEGPRCWGAVPAASQQSRPSSPQAGPSCCAARCDGGGCRRRRCVLPCGHWLGPSSQSAVRFGFGGEACRGVGGGSQWACTDTTYPPLTACRHHRPPHPPSRHTGGGRQWTCTERRGRRSPCRGGRGSVCACECGCVGGRPLKCTGRRGRSSSCKRGSEWWCSTVLSMRAVWQESRAGEGAHSRAAQQLTGEQSIG